MFLQHIADLKLLELKPEETSTLSVFRTETQRELCRTVVRDLSAVAGSGVLAKPLTTASHTRWCMELLAIAMAVPIDSDLDVKVMHDALHIYTRWLNIPTSDGRVGRPRCVDEDESEDFQRTIVDHISLLFHDRHRERPRLRSLFVQHRDVCASALRTYRILMSVHPNMSKQSWERLQCCLLGIGDYLLKPKERISELGDALCAQLVRVLLMSYLVPRCRNGHLWDLLRDVFRTWSHRLPVVKQWHAVMYALTMRLLAILWPREGDVVVKIHWADTTSADSLSLNRTEVVYLWYRLLHCIGAPADMTNPDCHAEYMLSVFELVDCFLHVGFHSKGFHSRSPFQPTELGDDALLRTPAGLAKLAYSRTQLHNHGPASSRPKSTPITPSASEAVHWGAGPGSHRARGQTSGPGVARGGSSPHARSNSTIPARGRVTPGGWELVGSAGDTGSDDVRSTGSADGPSPHQGDEVRREAMRQQAEAAHRRPRQLFHQASHKLFRVASGARVVQDEFRRLHSERRRKTVKATPTLRRSSHKGGSLSISVDQRNDEADSADPAFAERVHVAGVADSDLPAPPADLNDLLRVFGAWLFDAALDDRKGFEYGRASAIGILGRLFTSRGISCADVLPSYLARFYTCVRRGLKSDDQTLAAIICNCANIFSVNLKGVRCLIGDFKNPLLKLLILPSVAATPSGVGAGAGAGAGAGRTSAAPPTQFGGIDVWLIRYACVVMLQSLVCLPNNFEEPGNIGLFFTSQTDHIVTRLGDVGDGSEATQDEKERAALAPLGKQLRGFVNKLLVEALSREENEGTLQMLLWALGTKVLEDAATSPGVAQVAISAISQPLLRYHQSKKRWSANTASVALRVLGQCASLASIIHTSGTATIPLMVQRLAQFVRAGVNKLHKERDPGGATDILTGECFNTIQCWVEAAPWVVSLASCHNPLLQVISASTTTSSRSPDMFSRSSAERLLESMRGTAGRTSAVAVAPRSLHAVITDAELLQIGPINPDDKHAPELAAEKAAAQQGRLRCFMLQRHMIATFFEHRIPADAMDEGDSASAGAGAGAGAAESEAATPLQPVKNPGSALDPSDPAHQSVVTLVLRTPAGRYVWTARQNYTHRYADNDASTFAHTSKPASADGTSSSPAPRRGGRRFSMAASAPVPHLVQAVSTITTDPVLRLMSTCRKQLDDHYFADAVDERSAEDEDELIVRAAVSDAAAAAAAAAAEAGDIGPAGSYTSVVDTSPHAPATAEYFNGFANLLSLQISAEGERDTATTSTGLHMLSPSIAEDAPEAPPTAQVPTGDNTLSRPEPPYPYRHDHAFQAARRLLSNLGFLTLARYTDVMHVPMTDAAWVHIKNIDATAVRRQLAASVEYLACRRLPSGLDRLFVSRPSQDGVATKDDGFRSFVKSLGWWIDLAAHDNFSAGLDKSLVTGRVVYHGTPSVEIGWVVPGLEQMQPTDGAINECAAAIREAMPDATEEEVMKNARQQCRKICTRHVQSATESFPVQVVWNTTPYHYVPGSSTWAVHGLPECAVQIVIDPLPDSLFRIHVHVDQHTNTDNDMVTSVLGPLMDGMLVGGRVLGKLVAHTLVNAWLQMHQERGKKTLLIDGVNARRQLIGVFHDTHRVMRAFEETLAAVTTPAFTGV